MVGVSLGWNSQFTLSGCSLHKRVHHDTWPNWLVLSSKFTDFFYLVSFFSK